MNLTARLIIPLATFIAYLIATCIGTVLSPLEDPTHTTVTCPPQSHSNSTRPSLVTDPPHDILVSLHPVSFTIPIELDLSWKPRHHHSQPNALHDEHELELNQIQKLNHEIRRTISCNWTWIRNRNRNRNQNAELPSECEGAVNLASVLIIGTAALLGETMGSVQMMLGGEGVKEVWIGIQIG